MPAVTATPVPRMNQVRRRLELGVMCALLLRLLMGFEGSVQTHETGDHTQDQADQGQPRTCRQLSIQPLATEKAHDRGKRQLDANGADSGERLQLLAAIRAEHRV